MCVKWKHILSLLFFDARIKKTAKYCWSHGKWLKTSFPIDRSLVCVCKHVITIKVGRSIADNSMIQTVHIHNRQAFPIQLLKYAWLSRGFIGFDNAFPWVWCQPLFNPMLIRYYDGLFTGMFHNQNVFMQKYAQLRDCPNTNKASRNVLKKNICLFL